ncbi:MAG: hypothetical protein ACI9WL_000092, partial [Rubritalea sp.]
FIPLFKYKLTCKIIDVAFSESAVVELFNEVRDEVKDEVRDEVYITKSGSSSGRFRATSNAGVRLAGGRIDFKNNPDQIKIRHLAKEQCLN